MSSALAKSITSQRPPSRAGTASSTSVITVQRISPATQGRSQVILSDSEELASPIDDHKKRVIHQGRPNSIAGVPDGVGNLNRWSQSTSSSKSSSMGHQRKNSFAKRLSGSFGSLGNLGSSQQANTAPSTKNVLKKPYISPSNSPKKVSTKLPLQPQSPLRKRRPPPSPAGISETQATNGSSPPSPDTTATATSDSLTSATYMPGSGDYFNGSWGTGLAPNYSDSQSRLVESSYTRDVPARIRINPGAKNSFAPSNGGLKNAPQLSGSPLNSRTRVGGVPAEQEPLTGNADMLFTDPKAGLERSTSPPQGHEERARRRKAPSQKAMLSKALQKAKHAVVLDNAQNFEGAIDAYGDACNLLQQVMLRSSEDEDRKKLEKIVSLSSPKSGVNCQLIYLYRETPTRTGSENCRQTSWQC